MTKSPPNPWLAIFSSLSNHWDGKNWPYVAFPWVVSRNHRPRVRTHHLNSCNPGVVTQELLLLPHHLSNPTVLPFRVTHALLTGTMATPIRDRQYGLPIPGLKSSPEASRLTREQKIELARPVAELTFDPIWVRDHKERMDVWASRLVTGR